MGNNANGCRLISICSVLCDKAFPWAQLWSRAAEMPVWSYVGWVWRVPSSQSYHGMVSVFVLAFRSHCEHPCHFFDSCILTSCNSADGFASFKSLISFLTLLGDWYKNPPWSPQRKYILFLFLILCAHWSTKLHARWDRSPLHVCSSISQWGSQPVTERLHRGECKLQVYFNLILWPRTYVPL